MERLHAKHRGGRKAGRLQLERSRWLLSHIRTAKGLFFDREVRSVESLIWRYRKDSSTDIGSNRYGIYHSPYRKGYIYTNPSVVYGGLWMTWRETWPIPWGCQGLDKDRLAKADVAGDFCYCIRWWQSCRQFTIVLRKKAAEILVYFCAGIALMVFLTL